VRGLFAIGAFTVTRTVLSTRTQQPNIFTFLVNDVGLMDGSACGREFNKKPEINRLTNYHFALYHDESTLELIHPKGLSGMSQQFKQRCCDL
jgi:hypothetical protein